MKKEFKNQLYKTSGISKSYKEIRESIDLDKYTEVNCENLKPKKTKKIFIPIILACVGTCCAAVAAIVIANSLRPDTIIPQTADFIESYQSFDEFKTRFEQTKNESINPYLFEISENYNCYKSYSIYGICSCPSVNGKVQHNGSCKTFLANEAVCTFANSNNKEDILCSVTYLENSNYDKASLVWDFIDEDVIPPDQQPYREYEYTLMDKAGNKLVSVNANDRFAGFYSLIDSIMSHFENK